MSNDLLKAGAVLLVLLLVGLQAFGLLPAFMGWLKAAAIAALVPR